MPRATLMVRVLLIMGCAVALCLRADENDPMLNKRNSRRKVSVTLLGPANQIVGLDAQADSSQRDTDYLRVANPADVKILMPDGTEKRLPVKSMSINLEHATVADIHLLPLMKSVPFKDAVAELHRLMAVLDIKPDERMKATMARQWPKDSPGFDPIRRLGYEPLTYRAETPIAEDIVFLVKLRPGGDGGWFLVLSLSVDGQKRRALWDRPATNPETRPATTPG